MNNRHWMVIVITLVLLAVLLLPACAKPAPAPTVTPSPTTAAPKPATTPAPTTTAAPKPAATTPASQIYIPKPEPAASGIKTGGTLRVGHFSEAAALGHPALGSVAVDDMLASPALEQMVKIDGEGIYRPWLAESFKADYGSLSIAVTLRKGIKFQDGTDFNAEAVRWNLQMLKDHKLSSIANMQSVDIIDSYNIKINLNQWSPDIANLILASSSYMVSPTAWQKNGEEWGKQNPVGTGPFKLASRQRDVNVKYVKNPDYWLKGKPYLDGIDFLIIKDPVTRIAAFKAGDVDILLDPTTAQAQELKKDPKYVINSLRGLYRSYGLGPSADDPASPLANLKVRQALCYAVDRQALVDGIMLGYGIPGTQQCPPGTWANNPELKVFPYDPAKAKQLLAEAGYPNGFEMQLIGRTTGDDPLIAAAVQGMLGKVGIKSNLNLQAALGYTAIRTGGWKNGCLITGQPPAPFQVTFFSITTMRSVGRESSVSLLREPAIDDLVRQATTASDFKIQQAAVWRLMEAVYRDYVQIVPLFWGDALLVKYPYFKGDTFYVTGTTWAVPADAWLDR